MNSELVPYYFDILKQILTHVVTLGIALWVLKYHRYIYGAIRTLPRDLVAAKRAIRLGLDLRHVQNNDKSVGEVFDENVRKHPEKILFYFEDEKWTWKQVYQMSNKVANYFQEQGFKKGDSVAIFMENRPEYICLWLGLSKIGVAAGLTNYSLKLKPLQHCFDAVNSKAVIYNEELSPALQEVLDIGGLTGTKLYSFCSKESNPQISSAVHLTRGLETMPDTKPSVPEKIGFRDKLFYIYTSGTSGLPKAAIATHSRFLMTAVGNYHMHGLRKDDILYTALPLYHAAGNVLGGGPVLCYGMSMVIRKRFSANNFWKDCIKYNVTAAQYIGEICRYLFAQPPSPVDKSHKVRMMYGNGLRKEIWPDFVKRFNIPHISELYGSTEGNCNMINIDDTVGAVGFVPWYMGWIIPYILVKVDEATGEPLRDKKGRVITCKADEPGELMGKIEKNHPVKDFLGYTDKSSSNKKILENVFKKGDAYFRTGDILVRDIYGYFYFKDRQGDTFRWKGENCSTAEVESVISNVCGLNDVVVYGVEVPGTEGKAGMAAMAVDPNQPLDWNAFFTGISKSLPPYARPLFVRTLDHIERTGTYKLQKVAYQKQGFDVTKTQDKIYFLQGSKYVPLTKSLHDEIITGKIKV